MRALTTWLRTKAATQWQRLLKINDTPHSIAFGSAVGMFFGFTPLLGLKTLLSIGGAWLFRSNKIAAVITVTLHDLILPFAPIIYYWEYQMGMWILHGQLPARSQMVEHAWSDYMKWTTFFTLGQPMLIGSLFLGLPSGIVVYFVMRMLVKQARLVASAE